MHGFTRAVLTAALILLPVAATAAEAIPVKDFARHSPFSNLRLSPDGKHLALSMEDPANKSHALMIYAVSDMSKPTSMLRMPKYELPATILWVSNTRLIIEKARAYGSLDKPQLTGEIIATDLDGTHQDYLYGYNGFYQSSRAGTRNSDHGAGFYVGQPEPANGHFYMRTYSWNSNSHSALYDVDARRNTRKQIGDIDIDRMNFMVGADGQAHFAYGYGEDFVYKVFHKRGGGWASMTAAQIGGSFSPIRVAPDGKRIYARFAAGAGPTSLVEQDETGADRQVLAQGGFGSVGDIQWSALPYAPFATFPATGRPTVSYIDPNLPAAKLHRAISLKFPGEVVNFINFSDDGSELLFSVSSDRDPGTYYLIDTTHYKVVKLLAAEEWIDPAKMAQRRSLHFTTSDGHSMEAILTVPPGRKLEQLPMVLLPHGGPIGVQDDWFYDDDAQFLASRGYLVLQVNYRGSSGRGAGFEEAAYLKWGTRVQQDLIDGVKWAIGQHYADPKRICVYGGSFGGYSAMMSVIRAPKLFKCAVGYAGIYDLKMMYDKGDIGQSKAGRSYLNTVIGRNDAELDANSPDKLANRIDVPVLLVHGEDDQRAPFAQAKAMRAALEAAHKPCEWLVKPDEGHGFYDEDNRIEFYTRLQAFLEQHIGKGA